jgi:tetratricopeptide (TPR) repeat protein
LWVLALNRSSSHDNLSRLGATARRAAHAGNWAAVNDCAREILRLDKRNPEGWFLTGLLEKASGQEQKAFAAFSKALQFDSSRYDVAIELASLCQVFARYSVAVALLKRYEPGLKNSSYYLDMAADTYSKLGLHDKAWPLYFEANELQPDIDHFQVDLAACAVNCGKIEKAKTLYRGLIAKHPTDQINHYELSKLETAGSPGHTDQMKEILKVSQLPAEKNIFLYYAIAKELEDLGQWEEAFDYYQRGGDAARLEASESGFKVSSEVELIDAVIRVCDSAWLAEDREPGPKPDKTPVFIVGLPRTGTTLVERIVTGHSHVESAGEGQFIEMAIRRTCGLASRQKMTPAIIEAAAGKDPEKIAAAYMEAVNYKLGGWPIFVDKNPFNFLYLGLIATAFPNAKIIHLKRNPMDTCSAMFRQYECTQACTLDDAGQYYVAYDRLCNHWQELLQDRIIQIEYEKLINDSGQQTRELLERLGLDFEQDCLGNTDAGLDSNWTNWETQLQPLRRQLESAEIVID